MKSKRTFMPVESEHTRIEIPSLSRVIRGDPDLYIAWDRIDEPGDNPTWESKCGAVEQKSFGNAAKFYGFVGPDRVPISNEFTMTLISAKNAIEREYHKTREIKWEYDTDEDT